MGTPNKYEIGIKYMNPTKPIAANADVVWRVLSILTPVWHCIWAILLK